MKSKPLPNDFVAFADEPPPVPPRWLPHYRALLRLREALLQEHAEHSAAACTPHERGGADATDVAEDEASHRTLLAELAHEDSALAEINAALRRIHEGTYGICEDTGRIITAARLRAVPWTRWCRDAAAAREAKTRR